MIDRLWAAVYPSHVVGLGSLNDRYLCPALAPWAQLSPGSLCVTDKPAAHLGEREDERVPVLPQRLRRRYRQACLRKLANG